MKKIVSSGQIAITVSNHVPQCDFAFETCGYTVSGECVRRNLHLPLVSRGVCAWMVRVILEIQFQNEMVEMELSFRFTLLAANTKTHPGNDNVYVV